MSGETAEPQPTAKAKKGKELCVCGWGDECMRFRRYFDEVKRYDGHCIFAGDYRPRSKPQGDGKNSTTVIKHANFFDAVDRHFLIDCLSKTGKIVCIARHHWNRAALEYVDNENIR